MASAAATGEHAIEVESLNLWYGSFQALYEVDLTDPAGAGTRHPPRGTAGRDNSPRGPPAGVAAPRGAPRPPVYLPSTPSCLLMNHC